MAFDTKILIDKIKSLKDKAASGSFSDALVAALNTGNALMQRRIFFDNVDIFGNSFGGYVGTKKLLTRRAKERLLFKATQTTKVRINRNAPIPLTPYQRKRANRGRQIVRKDLELEGGLRRSIEVQIINERSAQIAFNTIEEAQIARGQENQITNIRNSQKGYTTGNGLKIFALNENEREQTNNQARELVKQILK